MTTRSADRQLVSAFVEATREKSLREVSRATGLSHQMVAKYRRGQVPLYLRQSTRESMAGYLRRSGWESEERLGDDERVRLLDLTEQLRAAVWAGDVERAREITDNIEATLR